MLGENVDIIFKAVISQNSLNSREAIPHSDEFKRKIESTHGFSPDFIEECIQLLKDAHKIFIIEIVQEDEARDIKKVEGYIDADLSTVRRLKNIYQKLLQDLYEEEHHQRMMAHQVIRELFPKMHMYNNTPLGYIANKAIMTEEYELLLEKDFSQYTESWKEEKLAELLRERGGELEQTLAESDREAEEEAARQEAEKEAKRAVDSKQGKELASPGGAKSIDKVLQIYGVEFFYRVNLRKYNFELIKKVIETRKITRRDDLLLLKEMIQKIKVNAHRDPGLADHLDELYELERTISRTRLMRH